MPTQPVRSRRGEIFPDEMASLQPNPGWNDGRFGQLFSRLDAAIDLYRRIVAEITWADDGEEEDNPTGRPRVYFDPLLTIETCQETQNGAWRTFDAVHVPLQGDETLLLVQDDPRRILDLYRSEVEDLRVWKGAEHAA